MFLLATPIIFYSYDFNRSTSINSKYVIDPEKNAGRGYQYDEVVRSREDRKKLNAGDCECCREVGLLYLVSPPHFYSSIGCSTTRPSDLCQADSNHHSGDPRRRHRRSLADATWPHSRRSLPLDARILKRIRRRFRVTGLTGRERRRRPITGILGSRRRRRSGRSMSARRRCISRKCRTLRRRLQVGWGSIGRGERVGGSMGSELAFFQRRHSVGSRIGRRWRGHSRLRSIGCGLWGCWTKGSYCTLLWVPSLFSVSFVVRSLTVSRLTSPPTVQYIWESGNGWDADVLTVSLPLNFHPSGIPISKR